MRPTKDVLAAVPPPVPADPDRPPDAVRLAIPAHLSFLPAIRAAVHAVLEAIGDGDSYADLQLAADEAAAVLIQDAQPWTMLHLSIVHDETDIYLRLATRRAQPGLRLVVHELTQLLLDSALESYEVFADGRWGYAILQTSQVASMTGS